MSLTQHLLQTTKIIILALVLAFGISYLHAAWVGPSQAPPLGNTPAPVNVGSVPQTKFGSLGVTGFFGGVEGYFSTNLGIGDSTPDTGEQVLKLDVEGAVGAKYYCDENGNNCQTISQLLGANRSCPVDQYVTGFDANGDLICAAGAGEVVEEPTGCGAASFVGSGSGGNDLCVLPNAGHGTEAGSCQEAGTCSYTCNNGTWNMNWNTCDDPYQ